MLAPLKLLGGSLCFFSTAGNIFPTENCCYPAMRKLQECRAVKVDCAFQVNCKWSACWNDALLTGIAFTGRANDVAAAAYDTDEIRIWTVI